MISNSNDNKFDRRSISSSSSYSNSINNEDEGIVLAAETALNPISVLEDRYMKTHHALNKSNEVYENGNFNDDELSDNENVITKF